MYVKSILNMPFNSVCYLVSDKSHCIAIDPAMEDMFAINNYLDNKNLTLDYILLTHEHYDHIAAIDQLRLEYKDVQLICHECCNEGMQLPERNLSKYMDVTNCSSFVPMPANKMWYGDSGEDYLKTQIYWFHTPGHTKGSVCILIEDWLFTGDTIIPGVKTYTKFPGGSKKDLLCSFNRLNTFLDNRVVTVLPGHLTGYTGNIKYMLDECR